MSRFTFVYDPCRTYEWVLTLTHIRTSHFLRMNEADQTYEWVMTKLMNESCPTYPWDMSHIQMSHVPLKNEPCCSFKCAVTVTNIGTSHLPRMDEACRRRHSYLRHDSFICVTWLIHMCAMTHSYVWHDSFICVTRIWMTTSHMWMSHVAHMNETCRTYEWAMSNIWTSHVIHMIESCCT